MTTKNNEIKKEREILQYLYDKGYIDFTGDEESLVLHANLTGKGLIDIFKAGSLSKEKDVLEMLDEMYEKKKLSLKELGLPLEDWWGESEMFSVNELEELKKRIEQK